MIQKTLIFAMFVCFIGGGITAAAVGITWFHEIRALYFDTSTYVEPKFELKHAKNILDYIPSYYMDDIGPQLQDSFENNVNTKEDFKPWQSRLLETHKIPYIDIGTTPSKNTPVLLETVRKQAYALEKYSLIASDSDTILYYKVKPIEEQKTCSVVISPGTGHQGARDIVGIDSDMSPYYYQGTIGTIIAEQTGCEVIVPELRGYGERQIESDYCNVYAKGAASTTCSHDVLAGALSRVGVDLGKKRLLDIVEILYYEYDDQRTWAVGGLSLGAHIAQSIATSNLDKFDAVFLASGILHESEAIPFPGSHPSLESWNMDDADKALLMAPIPLYTSIGQQESWYKLAEAKDRVTENYVQKAYNLLGYPEHFHYVAHNGAHEYDPKTLVVFLNKFL